MTDEVPDDIRKKLAPGFSFPKEDSRPRRGMWAPGAYFCRCTQCGVQFIGDKRAIWCADCAYDAPRSS
jgi:hypothetical protein